jgi:hypothetical protein
MIARNAARRCCAIANTLRRPRALSTLSVRGLTGLRNRYILKAAAELINGLAL